MESPFYCRGFTFSKNIFLLCVVKTTDKPSSLLYDKRRTEGKAGNPADPGEKFEEPERRKKPC
ncbi:hypothetical protein B5F35_05770 [Anaeromassilibacillus sp. An200]|nr:hypothetical protein B5F35_05770 [Anaeromassilibacillus sp. An200]